MKQFEELYSEYFKDVYYFILSLCNNESLSEDITQETFFRALKNINTFKGKCDIKVWLFQIAKNLYFREFRKDKKVIDNDKKELVENESFLEKLLDNETVNTIHKLVHSLKEPYKEVFSLRVFGECSFLQISELFGKTDSWARVTFYRAKIKIMEGLKDERM